MRHEPEFYDGKAEFWLEPEFLANLSFAPNAQKKIGSDAVADVTSHSAKKWEDK